MAISNKVSIFAMSKQLKNNNNMATEILKIVDKNDSFIVHVVKSDFVPSDNIVRFAVESMDDKNCLRLGRMILDSAFIVMDDDGDNPTSKVKVTITYEQITE